MSSRGIHILIFPTVFSVRKYRRQYNTCSFARLIVCVSLALCVDSFRLIGFKRLSCFVRSHLRSQPLPPPPFPTTAHHSISAPHTQSSSTNIISDVHCVVIGRQRRWLQLTRRQASPASAPIVPTRCHSACVRIEPLTVDCCRCSPSRSPHRHPWSVFFSLSI